MKYFCSVTEYGRAIDYNNQCCIVIIDQLSHFGDENSTIGINLV